MKETIEFYYDLLVEDYKEKNDKYYFKAGNCDYVFTFYNRSLDELEDLCAVILELKGKGISVNEFVQNKKQSYLTGVAGYNYVLLKIFHANETYDIFDIIKLNDNLMVTADNSRLYRNKWGFLWTKKLDFVESQVNELCLEKKVIINSFCYFAGLTEMAISYVNIADAHYGMFAPKICLSHRRVFFPNYKLNYLNPLSFIFDVGVRDVAEYLKYEFLCSPNDAMEELIIFLRIQKLNLYEYHLLFARLLYPSFYFDIFDNVVNNKGEEEHLVKIINCVDGYEKFLKKAYQEISKYAPLEKFGFL